ncbi:MAG: RsmB/NOP family class I SAM-dependent RNA methyltransferase, partial [Gemmatimonadota bacterium]
LFHVQQSVMGLPSLALAPSPGDRVLDLCAAPGGKTFHLAEIMDETGPIVAVDPKEKRLRGLLGNMYRLGVSNVLVVAADGRELPGGAAFDRVLVDAPCSGEGNYRRQGHLPARGRGFTRYATALQEALLRRAVAVTRPGGVLVYSTCTYAPEENEAVVDRVLRDAPVRVEPIELGAPHDPGWTRWEGTDLHPDLHHAWRVYPHHLDSGGLFMVRLRRLNDCAAGADGSAVDGSGANVPRDPAEGGFALDVDAPRTRDAEEQGWSRVPVGFPGEDSEAASARVERAHLELEHRFGYDPDWIRRLGWMVRGDHLWIHTAGEWPVTAWRRSRPGSDWRVVSLGLRALRRGPGGRETPSNHFLTRWPRDIAPERKVDLTAGELRTLVAGDAQPPGELPTGPVAHVWEGTVLGRGMVGRAGLRQELGKAHAERLSRILDPS